MGRLRSSEKNVVHDTSACMSYSRRASSSAENTHLHMHIDARKKFGT